MGCVRSQLVESCSIAMHANHVRNTPGCSVASRRPESVGIRPQRNHLPPNEDPRSGRRDRWKPEGNTGICSAARTVARAHICRERQCRNQRRYSKGARAEGCVVSSRRACVEEHLATCVSNVMARPSCREGRAHDPRDLPPCTVQSLLDALTGSPVVNGLCGGSRDCGHAIHLPNRQRSRGREGRGHKTRGAGGASPWTPIH